MLQDCYKAKARSYVSNWHTEATNLCKDIEVSLLRLPLVVTSVFLRKDRISDSAWAWLWNDIDMILWDNNEPISI